jgi:branched-chain amino acid transport system ATP-binding protein
LVEQNARLALEIAHRGYVIETGKIVLEGFSKSLLHNDAVRKAYLGE